MDDVKTFFEDIFDWEIVQRPDDHPPEKRDSSVLSTFLSEFFTPDPKALPYPYGSQDHKDAASVIKTCEAFLKVNTVRGKKVVSVMRS